MVIRLVSRRVALDVSARRVPGGMAYMGAVRRKGLHEARLKRAVAALGRLQRRIGRGPAALARHVDAGEGDVPDDPVLDADDAAGIAAVGARHVDIVEPHATHRRDAGRQPRAVATRQEDGDWVVDYVRHPDVTSGTNLTR